MKATGIVKRVGSSGPVNMPKALRKSLGIRACDPLEIYTDENKIIFVKYSSNFSHISTNLNTKSPSVILIPKFNGKTT